MGDKDEILENTKATMAMEGLPLSEEDEKILRDCLDGKTSFEEALAEAIEQFLVA